MIVPFVVLCALIPSAPVVQGSEFAPLECHRYSSGVLAVSAECPPGSRRWFLLDTGSPDTVVASASVKNPGDDVALVLKVGGSLIEGKALVEPEVAKFGFLKDGPKIEGILGTDLLQKLQIGFRREGGKLYARAAIAGAFDDGMAHALKKIGAATDRSRTSVLRLASTEDGWFYASTQYGDTSAMAVVDTGGSAMFVPKDTLPPIGGRIQAHSSLGTNPVGLAVGKVASSGMKARIFVGGIRDAETPPTLSVPALSDAWWYIDFVNKRFAFDTPTIEQDAERMFSLLLGRETRLGSDGLEAKVLVGGERRWQPVVSMGGVRVDSWLDCFRRAATEESALQELLSATRSLMSLMSFETMEGQRLKTVRIDKE